MYESCGGAPAAGVVCGVGTVAGRRHMIIANDATVKAGAFFPATAKKVLRAQRIAMQNRLPLIYLVDSAGVFLPLQEDVFPDEDDFGRIFRNNAVISAAGLGQIAAIMGNCVAGGGYLPVLCDKLLMTDGSGLYLAGPALVKSAIGQEVSSEELGRRRDARPGERHDRLSRSRRRKLALSGCGGWRPRSGPTTPQPPAAVCPRRRRSLRSARRAIFTTSSAPIRTSSTKFATCWIASSMPAASTNTRPNTARRSFAARRGWAAFPSASWPTSIIGCGRPTARCNSAACCMSIAPKRRPGS